MGSGVFDAVWSTADKKGIYPHGTKNFLYSIVIMTIEYNTFALSVKLIRPFSLSATLSMPQKRRRLFAGPPPGGAINQKDKNTEKISMAPAQG